MISVRLHPQDHINSILEDVTDYGTNTTYKGNDCIVFENDLTQNADSIYKIESIKKNPDTYTTEITYIAPSDGATIYIHEKWIKSIIIDGEEYELEYTKPWFELPNIKTNKQFTFFNLDDCTIFYNDAVCISCGTSLDHPTEDKLCDKCVDTMTKLNNYSYKPEPVFVGGQSNKYYGLELEYGFTNKREAAKIMTRHQASLYLKSDSSVRGGDFNAELVSHPHTFAELMKPDSFIHTVSHAKVNPSESNGCHIHISRTAFNDNKHYAMFYFLLHASKDLLEFVGGRQLNNYCKFLATGRIHTKANVQDSSDRAKAVNETNQHTVEVRIFNSTNDSAHIRRYIQFVDSAIEYTRSAKKVISVKNFFSYIKSNRDIYPDLMAHVADYKSALPAPITFREPIIKEMDIGRIAIDNLKDIISFSVNSDTYELDTSSGNITFTGDGHINFYARRNTSGSRDSYTLPISSISKCKVAL